MSTMQVRSGFVIAGTALLLSQAAWAQDRPLPDLTTFLANVRERLQPDEARQSAYMYTETARRTLLDGRGRPKSEVVSLSESYPGLGPTARRWERPIVRDGKRVSEAELKKLDAERYKEAEQYARDLKNPAKVREMAREREKQQAEAKAAVDDAFHVLAVTMVRRESVNAVDAIVLAFTPRPNVSASTRSGRALQAFSGTAWIGESDYELIKIEVEAIKLFRVGFGLVASLGKGSRASFERRRVDSDEWLPVRATYDIAGRLMLFKGLRERASIEYSDYRKFGVDTSAVVSLPRQ
jgi:hypothetical protein